MTAAPLIQLESVSFAYDGPQVLRDVSLSIPRGDLACVIGPNGGGKSTLIRLMLGLLEPQSGRVRVFGMSPEAGRERIGYLPQRVHFDPQFPVSVQDVVLMGRLGRSRWLGMWSGSDRAVSSRALEDVGLAGLERRPFAALSGGQRQRVLIARALASEPDLLVLDEPTSNLDIKVEEQLYSLLRTLNERLTVVLVSHDVNLVSKYVKTAICVNKTVHMHTSAQINEQVIEELFGRQVRTVHHHHPGCGHDHDQPGDAQPTTRPVAPPKAEPNP
jgi:zinc transport system ATP-binding protein